MWRLIGLREIGFLYNLRETYDEYDNQTKISFVWAEVKKRKKSKKS
jgi:hypothetical protein